MLRVALIHARSEGAARSGQGAAPPLGLMALAAHARRALPGRVVFELRDAYFYDYAELRSWLERFRPTVVALSGITAYAAQMGKLATLVTRTLGPGVRLVVGGPHATSYPEGCLALDGVDGVVPGEGERPFVDYLEHALGERARADVRGLVHREGDRVVRNPPAPRPETLDALEPLAYDLIDLDFYEDAPNALATIVLPPHRYVALFTSRGCPFRCTFCHNVFGHRFRGQSIDRVLDELEGLALQHGVADIHFYDDIFNGRPGRLLELCQGIERRRLKLRLYFDNGLRTDTLDRVQLEAMRSAGVVYFGAAIESASTRVQQLIHKRLDVERVLENVAIADELGIFTTGFMMVGIPGETREEIALTLRTAELSRLSYVYFSVANPYADTPIGQEVAARGIDISPEQLVGYSSPGKNYAGIPERELRNMLRGGYRRFWTPARLVSFVANHPTPDGLALALTTGSTLTNLARRVGSVLGWAEDNGGEATWRAPRRHSPGAARLLGAAGGFGGRLALGLHRAGRRPWSLPAELRGQVATRPKRPPRGMP